MSVEFSSNALVESSHYDQLTLDNAKARVLLAVLRLSAKLAGRCSIFEARRCIIRARSWPLEEGLARSVDLFAAFVENAAELGATDIYWS